MRPSASDRLEALMRDPTISDILINGPKTVYVERKGRLERTTSPFTTAATCCRSSSGSRPTWAGGSTKLAPWSTPGLPDGSRLNAIIQPLALKVPLVSIRRFGARPLLVNDLLANGSITQEMLQFLRPASRPASTS